MKKDDNLNSKTPKWFQEWHWKHFRPVKDRTFNNRTLIYVILGAVIAAAFANNGDSIGKIVQAYTGG